jgi:L-aspartate oxidase
MGGVVTDLDGRTTLPGLFAAGEVACTGVHGANRLASNSLLEGLVFGARTGLAMRARGEEPIDSATLNGYDPAPVGEPRRFDGHVERLPSTVLQAVMWEKVGLFRDADGLSQALAYLEPLWRAIVPAADGERPMRSDEWRAASLLTVGRLIARAALRREESRGAHFRTDFPVRDDARWKRRIMERRA